MSTFTTPRRAVPKPRSSGLLASVGLASASILGVLLVVVIAYVLGVLFWGWLLMLGMGNWGPYHWSYAYTITHWALLCPFVLG